MVRELSDRGAGVRAEDAWHLPRGVRDVLRQRLYSLTASAREVIGCAAVLGREFDVGLLAQVAGLSDEHVTDSMEEARRAGWLVEVERSWEAGYAFRHELMRQAVHSDLPARQRQRLHLRAADALEGTGLRRVADTAAAAAHLRAAGSLVDRTRTAEVSLRAAEETASVYAWDEAVGHAEAAVAILAHAGASATQQAEAAVRTAALLERSTRDYRRAVEHLEFALEHYRAVGDHVATASVRSHLGRVLSMHYSAMDIPTSLEHFAAAEPHLHDDTATFDAYRGQAQAAMFALRTEQGCAIADRALALASELDRGDLIALAHSIQGAHRFHRGELAAAHAHIDQAWAIAQDLGDPHVVWETVAAVSVATNMYLLDPTSSATWCRRGLGKARLETIVRAHQGLTDQLVYALASMGELAASREAASQLPEDAVSRRHLLLLAGDWEDAEEAWAAALENDLAHGDLMNAVLNAYWLAQAQRLLGRAEGAIATWARALALTPEGAHLPAELVARAELARGLATGGEIGDAAEHLRRCEAILAPEEDWRGQAGNVELARGAVAAARGRYELAETYHERALAVFTAYHLPWRRAEALLAWARWLPAAGRQSDAQAKLWAAADVYQQIGAADRWRLVTSPAGHDPT